MHDKMELAGLAYRRYPGMPLPMAVECFLSDRRKAGLGALDERKRRVGADISNYKRDVMEHGQVRYHLVRHTPAHRKYDLPPCAAFDPEAPGMDTMTVRTFEVPAKNVHLCVPADYRDFHEQALRRRVAQALREARRQLRSREA